MPATWVTAAITTRRDESGPGVVAL